MLQRKELGSLSLMTNFSWTFAGRIVYSACQWGILTMLAKLTSPVMVGRYSLGLALTAPVIMLTNLQLRGVQATDARRDYAFGHYLALRLVMTALSLLVIFGLALFGGYDSHVISVVIMVGLAKAVEAVSDVYFGHLQQRERMDVSGRALILKGVFSLIVMSSVVSLTGDILWGVASLSVVWSAVLLGYVMPQTGLVATDEERMQGLRPVWQWRKLGRLTWLAMPLGLVMMLISLESSIPRFFIERSFGEAELGYFSAMAYISVVGSTVVGALGQTVTPRLAQYFAFGQRRAFIRLLSQMVLLGAGLGVAGVAGALLLGRPLLTLLYRPEYAQRLDVFASLMVATGLSYVISFLGYAMTAARRFRPQLPLFAVSAVATTIFCALLVPRYGMLGAAYALTATALIRLTGSGVVIWHALESQQNQREVGIA